MHRYGHWEIGMTEIAFATLTIYTTTTLTLSIAVNVCWSLCSNCNKNGGKNVHSYFFSFFLSLSLLFREWASKPISDGHMPHFYFLANFY